MRILNLIESTLVVLIFIVALGIYDASAWEPVGSGTVIKELPDPWYVNSSVRDSYNSFEVSDDTVNSYGFVERETKRFDCGPNIFGEQECRERQW